MTNVTIWQEGFFRSLKAEGHAPSTETCNYITGVLYSLAGYVENLEKDGFAEVQDMRIEPGDFYVAARARNFLAADRMNAVFDAAIIGLIQLQKADPYAVAVNKRRV